MKRSTLSTMVVGNYLNSTCVQDSQIKLKLKNSSSHGNPKSVPLVLHDRVFTFKITLFFKCLMRSLLRLNKNITNCHLFADVDLKSFVFSFAWTEAERNSFVISKYSFVKLGTKILLRFVMYFLFDILSNGKMVTFKIETKWIKAYLEYILMGKRFRSIFSKTTSNEDAIHILENCGNFSSLCSILMSFCS